MKTKQGSSAKAWLLAILVQQALTCGNAFAVPGNPDLGVPTTTDNTCEFGHVVFSDEYQGTGADRITIEEWTNRILRSAATHCTNGAQFAIARAKPTGGWPHDMYQVAALVCQRPDIQETSAEGGKLSFRCKLTKLDGLRAKVARGEKLFSWATDRVPPRPDDLQELKRRENERRPVQTAPKVDATKASPDPADCSQAANVETTRCRSLLLPGVR